MKVDYDDLIINYYEKMEIIEKQDIEIRSLNREIERLHSIIKEARELLNDENYLDKLDCYTYPKEVIEILDQEVN